MFNDLKRIMFNMVKFGFYSGEKITEATLKKGKKILKDYLKKLLIN